MTGLVELENTSRGDEAGRQAPPTAEARPSRRDRRRQARERDEHDLDLAASASNLPPDAARYVRCRILPYARFCENQAHGSRLAYYWLRIPAITLAAVVPALVAANVGPGVRWLATGLGIIVAATTATEHFLNVGARWRLYRATVESLKSETWSYLLRAGPYSQCQTHEAGLPEFVKRAERMVQQDWSAYVSIVNTETRNSARDLAAPGKAPDATGHPS